MNKQDMIKYGVIIGGVVAGYWYITNYGPDGPVSVNGVHTGHASYWDIWFGTGVGSLPTITPNPGPVPGYPNQPALPGTTPIVTQPGTINPVPAVAGLRQQIIVASTGNPAVNGGYAVPDVWSYYWQQITGRGITAQQLGSAFPPGASGQGAPLNLDQFLAGLSSVGLSGISSIVPAPAYPSLPSMSFGGSYPRRGNFRSGKPTLVN